MDRTTGTAQYRASAHTFRNIPDQKRRYPNIEQKTMLYIWCEKNFKCLTLLSNLIEKTKLLEEGLTEDGEGLTEVNRRR
uniref:Uncharacterized protein n=1 Tax=Romanomermis culicivorax TaxID=13658 RepID=A0A915JWF0_ROMCU